MKADGSCGHPSLTYNPNTDKDDYKCGNAHCSFDNHEDGVKKVKEFHKHPKRHTDYFNKHGKILGVNVGYDAWEEPEVFYHVGQWFQFKEGSYVGGKYHIAIIGSRLCIVNAEKQPNWQMPMGVGNSKRITKEEFTAMVGGKPESFIPIEVEIKVVES